MLLAKRLFAYVLLAIVDCGRFSALISASSGYCQQHVLAKKGDLRIVAVLGLSKSNGRTCADVSPEAYQAALALSWITELLNGDGSDNSSYIPGVSVGFDIYDDCGIQELALDAILRSESIPSLSCSGTQTDQLPLTAGFIVGPNEESLVAVSNFVRPEDVVFGLSPAITQNEGWGNILRLRPPIESQSKMTLELLRYLKWNYIGVIYTDDMYGRSSFQNFKKMTHQARVCVASYSKISGPMANDSEVTKSVDNAMIEIRRRQYQAEKSNVAVVYFGDMRGAGVILNVLSKSLQSKLYENDKFMHWIFPQEVGTEPEFQKFLSKNKELANFIITVSPTATIFHEFQEYYVDSLGETNNTWLEAFASNQHNCSPSPDVASNIPACTKDNVLKGFRQADSVIAIVDSVFSIVEVLKKQHDQHCGTAASICKRMEREVADGLYPEIHQINLNYSEFPRKFVPENLTSHSIVFDSDGFVHVNGGSMFEIYTVQASSSRFSMIGDFGGSELIIKYSFETPTAISRCSKNCQECIDTDEKQFVYIPGKILILGLFSIRSNVAGEFQCGDYRKSESSITAALSFIESVKYMKQKTKIDFGAIAFDDCYSSLNSISFTSNLFSGKKVLVDPKSGTQIEPSQIVAVVGALSSPVTLAVAELLTPLRIPMVSYGASACWLDDRNKYPYFLRTVPSDTLQVDAMLSILNYLNITYVGSVHINDAYGNNGILALKTKANNSGICFEGPYSLDENDRQSFDNAISRMKNQLVKVVVLFGLDTTAETLLNRIKTEYKSGFVFLASEGWGHSRYLLEDGRGEACEGSIVLNVQTIEHSDESFRTFLQNLTPATAKKEPWTQHLWEHIMQCDFLESFSHRYDKICSESGKLIDDDINQLYINQRRVHTMNAVYAIGKGVQTINVSKGNEDLTVYLRGNPKIFVNAIRESVILTTNGESFRPFKEDGNGNIGFTVNAIQKIQGRFEYIKIGSFDESKRLDIHNIEKFYEQNDVTCMDRSTCTSLPACSLGTIRTLLSTASSATKADEVVSPYMSAVIVLAVFTGILTLVIILMMLIFIRQERTKTANLHRNTFINSHLTTNTEDIYNEPRDSIYSGIHNEALEHSSQSSNRRRIPIPNGMLNSPSESDKSIQYSRLNPDGTVFISMNSPPSPRTPCTPSSSKLFPIHLRNRSHSSTASSLISEKLSGIEFPERSVNQTDSLSNPGNQNITYITAKDLDIQEEDDNESILSATSYTDRRLELKRDPTENPNYSFGALPRQTLSEEHKTTNIPDWLPLQSQPQKKSDTLSSKQTGNWLDSQNTKQSFELPIKLVPDVIMHECSCDSNMTVFI